MGWFPLQFPA
jgi:hypothetical protein